MGILRQTRWAVLVLLLAASVQAGPITALYNRAEDNGDPVIIDLAEHSQVTVNGDGSVNYIGSCPSPKGDWVSEWDVDISGSALRGGSELFIFASIGLTSLVNAESDFQITVTLPGTVPGPTSISGSVSGSVGDTSGDGDGATLSANLAADPFYTARIDADVVRTLLDAPFTFTAPPNLTDPWDGGDFVDEGPHAAVLSEISIDHNFRLTGLDSVAITSTLRVVPEPTTMAFMLIGVSAIAWRRRR